MDDRAWLRLRGSFADGICHCPSPSSVLVSDPGDGGEFDCDAAGELREDRVNDGIFLGAKGPLLAFWPMCISATLLEFERRKSDLMDLAADFLTGEGPFGEGDEGGRSWV